MRAVVNEQFGPPEILQEKEIERPQVAKDEVLIKTYATSVNTIDIVFRSGMKVMFGLVRLSTGIRSPKKQLLGWDIAGEIIEIGNNVTEFEVGDQIYGGTKSGAFAEYAVSRTSTIAQKPKSMNYTEAGVMPMGALSALQGLRDSGEIKEHQDVLIYGASGGIGTYAVQLAKYYGTTVTGIASGKNEELVRSLGADIFVDYTKEDFTKRPEKYDIVFDTVSKSPKSRWKNALKDNGIFVNAGSPYMSMTHFFLSQLGNSFRSKQYRSFDTTYTKKDLEFLAELANDGIIKSIIDKSFSLNELVEAHKYYELGHTAGKVAVIVREEES